MNQFWIFVSVAGLVFFISQAFMVRSVKKTEERPYRLISKDESVEIRYYPEAVLASVRMSGNKYSEISSRGFRTLANYIFGGNKKNQSIAMTSPVEMQMSDTMSRMSFVMPKNYALGDLPSPENESVLLHNVPGEYVAVISFSGYASDQKIERYTELLKTTLKEKKISFNPPFRYLGYNPPFQVVGRRNEIIVNIQYAESSTP